MSTLLKVLKYVFVSLVFTTFAGTAIAAVVILFFSAGLPNIITIEDYKPPVVSRVLGKNDVVVGEFYEERRYAIPMEKIPDMVSRAFISAEDDRFYDHQGVDFQGILRATFANLRAGKVVQGGSTITQQVAKSLLLTPERSFIRKIKEVILSYRMEKNLTKPQILYLYLNQIYLGQGAYGIEAAAKVYFNKETKDLTVFEAAILAGLPQAPSKYSPISNPKKAKERQLYVLRRMHEDGVITQNQMEEATKASVRLYIAQDINKKTAPYYVEYLRKYVYEKYGKEALYQGGLTIRTPLDPALSTVGMKAVQDGLRNVDKKQGWRGALAVARNDAEFIKNITQAEEYNILKNYPYILMGEDGQHIKDLRKRLGGVKTEAELFTEGEIYKGVVLSVDDKNKETTVKLTSNFKGIIPLEKMSWAQPVKTPSSTGISPIGKPSIALDKGDLIFVKLVSRAGKNELPVLALEQDPLVQGALLSMDATTGEVMAMVGGFDYEQSEFNRALQASRQPGSAYKPIIYAAAIDKGFTPATIIQDSPIVFDAGDNGKWKPENFEEKFYGDTTFRSSLIKSRNIPTIKIVQDIQIPYLIDYSKRLGMSEGLNPDLSISLGTLSISLMDMVKAYAVFPRGGRRVKPIFIQKITDRTGNILEETIPTPNAPPVNLVLPVPPKAVKVCGELQAERNNGTDDPKRGEFVEDPADPDRVMDPRTAYVMTHLMNEVTTMGTGAEAKNLGRMAAGKTGTTNDYIDAWFMGFTPQIITGVWAGFDAQKTIAPKATGAMVSLPIWLEYMKEAVKGYPDVEFQMPKGVKTVYIDSKTGRLTSPNSPGAIQEAFVEGTEPGSSYVAPASITNDNTNKADSSAESKPQGTSAPAADPQTEDFFKEDIQ